MPAAAAAAAPPRSPKLVAGTLFPSSEGSGKLGAFVPNKVAATGSKGQRPAARQRRAAAQQAEHSEAEGSEASDSEDSNGEGVMDLHSDCRDSECSDSEDGEGGESLQEAVAWRLAAVTVRSGRAAPLMFLSSD